MKEELSEYELEILKRLENKFSTDPEETSPFKNYLLLLKKNIFGTYLMSYYNEPIHHDIFPIPEKYQNSYILLYSEKNRYEFLLNALMTFWQNDIDNLIPLLTYYEIKQMESNLNFTDIQSLEGFIQKYSEQWNDILQIPNIEDELNSFGISILKDSIEISYSWISPSYFMNKHLFYHILLFYFESLKQSKFLNHMNYIDKNIKLINDFIDLIKKI